MHQPANMVTNVALLTKVPHDGGSLPTGAVPVLSLLAWTTIAVMAITNPSGTIAVQSLRSGSIAVLGVGGFAALTLPLMVANSTTAARFFFVFFGGLAVLVADAWFAALTVHRDFLTFPAQIIMVFVTLFVMKLDRLGLVTHKQITYRRISTGAMILVALWVSWLMLMSYAIVVREEPRWIESTAYNIVNGLIGLALLAAATTLREQAKRTLRVRNKVLFLDHRNISQIISPQETTVVCAFLHAPDYICTCQTLRQRLGGPHGSPQDCDQCMAAKWTVYNCATYRNIKNRIADVKKHLELLRIGTIVPAAENPRDVKEAGWRLLTFEGVRIVIEDSASTE